MKVTLLTHTPEPEKLIAAAAKLCYASAEIDELLRNLTPEKTASFIAHLESLGHESPFEHASFTFGIEGVSRALLAQITRHRIASFSVQSQRYVSYKDGFGYIVPPAIAALGEDAAAEYRGQMAQMQQWYEEWQERLGAAGEKSNEDARFVLPGACETRIMLTMNARELRHFFALRMCSRAQWEIRALAESMFALCYKEVPALFADAGPECLRRGCPEGVKSCGRQAEMRARREAFLRENQPSGLAEA